MDDLEHRRQQALDRAARRYSDGILDDDTFDRAVSEIQAAEDVPALTRVVSRYLPAESGQMPAPDPGQSLVAIMSERSFHPTRLDHRYVSTTAVMGTLTIDLRELVLEQDTRVHVVAVMGEVRIRLPAGVPTTNSISAFMAEHNDRSDRGESRVAGSPTLHLTGTAILAEVTVE